METIFRLGLNFAGLMITAIVFFLFHKQIQDKNKENKIFLLLAYFIGIELSLDSVFWLIDTKTIFMGRELNLVVNFLYYLFQIVHCYAWMWFCEIHMECKESRIKTFIFSLPMVLGILLLIVNIWSGCVFSVDVHNVYARTWGIWGTLEAACCLFYPCYCIILVLFKMLHGEKQIRQSGGYLLFVSMVPIICSIVQMLFYGLNFIWLGNALAVLLILIEIEVKQYQQIKQELAEQRIQIMLSQIQPHFLYNSLTSIAYLCDNDPKKAKEATVSFARYLRVNLDSLKQARPVPFEKELNHIKSYLFLEKMRFQDELNVEYDIETKSFDIPALTVQPLVENAVKYGVCPCEDGGTVTIRTREMADCYTITVSDDGVGFDPYETQYDGRTHIGLDNVRSRLMSMCKGRLELTTEPGVGTTVTITLPKEIE